ERRRTGVAGTTGGDGQDGNSGCASRNATGLAPGQHGATGTRRPTMPQRIVSTPRLFVSFVAFCKIPAPLPTPRPPTLLLSRPIPNPKFSHRPNSQLLNHFHTPPPCFSLPTRNFLYMEGSRSGSP